MYSASWERRRSSDSSPPLDRPTVVILPIGSTEQHGPHLPVGTDTMLVAEIAQRAAEAASNAIEVRVLPALWISLAEHHMKFPGSLTLDAGTFEAVIGSIIRSVARQGFDKALLLNGHGGNMRALPGIADGLTRELGIPVTTATYWLVASSAFGQLLEGQPNLRHACEAETSMMMALHPELVDEAEARVVRAPAEFPDVTTGLHLWRSMEQITSSGVIGTPAFATAVKGEKLLQAAAFALAEQLAEPASWYA